MAAMLLQISLTMPILANVLCKPGEILHPGTSIECRIFPVSARANPTNQGQPREQHRLANVEASVEALGLGLSYGLS